MSRIGKKPVQVPAGITATVDGQKVTAKGPKGELFFVANDEVGVKLEDNAVVVTPLNQTKDARAKWGMSRTMIENIFKGVKDGYETQARNQRRRLSCIHAGQEPATGSRLQPRRGL